MLAQRSSRKRRKERQRRATADRPDGQRHDEETGGDHAPAPRHEESAMARGYVRGRAKDDAARAALKPLAPGERPVAVTIAGAVALVFAAANLSAYLAGLEIRGERPALIGVLLYTGLMLAAAWGCFRARYWAVLGMEALLGLIVVIFSLLVVRAGSAVELLIGLAVIGLAGTLFWFLIKAMARIQMPERPGASEGR